jgi:hypothetical protein
LITAGNPPPLPGEVAIDELKIYDGDNHLILWNTLGSAEEIMHSAVGLDGSFNGGGGAHFVPGIAGNAVMASPVFAIGPAPPTVGGSVTGIIPENGKGTVVCQNLTTHEAVRIPLGAATAWDCEDAGLEVSPGDRIKIQLHLKGTAQ